MNQTATGPILTTDGVPLKASLQTAERKNKIKAVVLVLPLILFFTYYIHNSYRRYVNA